MASGLTLHTTCQNHHITLYDAHFAGTEFKGHIEGPCYNMNITFKHMIVTNKRDPCTEKWFGGILNNEHINEYVLIHARESIDNTTGLDCWESSVIMPGTASLWDKCRFVQFDDIMKGVHDG